MSNDRYVSPLSERYASREMQYISPRIRSSAHGEDFGSLWLKQKKNLA